MRQLLPVPLAEIDPYDAYRPSEPHAPVLRLNMVASLDGSVTDREGRAGGLGGDADRELFRTLRALADVILVGAGTARAEGYGPHRVRADLRERRRADGRVNPAPIAVVTRSGELGPSSRLLTEAVTPTIVLTTAATAARLQAEDVPADVVGIGEDAVDVAAAVRWLHGRGLVHVLCEGGPTLNRELLDAGLVDELCLTVAPQVVGVAGLPAVAPGRGPDRFTLHSAYTADDELFLRYGTR